MSHDFPFDESPNVAVLTTRGVIDGTDWIAFVSLDDEDGEWQFIGSRGASMDEAMVVALRRVLERDPTIAELADLPYGGKASRASEADPWVRE